MRTFVNSFIRKSDVTSFKMPRVSLISVKQHQAMWEISLWQKICQPCCRLRVKSLLLALGRRSVSCVMQKFDEGVVENSLVQQCQLIGIMGAGGDKCLIASRHVISVQTAIGSEFESNSGRKNNVMCSYSYLTAMQCNIQCTCKCACIYLKFFILPAKQQKSKNQFKCTRYLHVSRDTTLINLPLW